MNLQTTFLLLALLLHALLLTLLFLRSAARSFPIFTALIAFYLLRSLLLYGLFGHVDSDAYELWFNALDLVDLLLQVLVVWELFRKAHAVSSPPVAAATVDYSSSQTFGGIALFTVLLLLSVGAAWTISLVVPATVHFPSDRGILLASALMLLAALTAIRNAATLARRILFGFGVLGAANILCQVERTLAAFRRAPISFRRWSYIEAAAYLAIVVFWIGTIALRRVRPRAGGVSGSPLSSCRL